MGGQSKVNQQMQQDAAAARAQEQTQFEQMMKPTPGQDRFEKGASNFQSWLGNKNYSAAPDASSVLNFDLWDPSHVQQQQQRMSNVQGIGAANMGGSGDQSVALQLAKQHSADQAGQDAGQAWENAVHATDNYYKSGDMSWSQLETQKGMGLLNNATSREMGYNDQYVATRPQSILPMLLGGALGAGGALLGNPGLFASASKPGGCWIAEAIYGVDDPRTLLLRQYLNGEFRRSLTGRIVMAVYVTIGRPVAAIVRRSSLLQSLFRRTLFDRALASATKWQDANTAS